MSQLEKLIDKFKNNRGDVRIAELEKILTSCCYKKVRQKGSHIHYRKINAPFLTIPVHQKKVKQVYVKEIFKLLNL